MHGAMPQMSDGNPMMLPPTDMPRIWRAMLVYSTRERGAADWLKRDNVWAYWPNYANQVSAGKGRRRQELCAVIPGYLFVAFHPESDDPYGLVNKTPGIYGFLRESSGHALTIRDEDIEIIRKIEGGLNLPIDQKTAHRFKTGDKVRFCDDVYHRWPPGKVARLAERGQIVVEVQMLGRVVPISVFAHQIERCS